MSERKPLGTDLPSDVVDQFSEWCQRVRYSKTKAATAAFYLIQRLPLSLRVAVMEEDWDRIDRLWADVDENVAAGAAGDEATADEASENARPQDTQGKSKEAWR